MKGGARRLVTGTLLALIGAGVVAALLLPLPSLHSVVWDALENAAHAPIFGLVALVALMAVRGESTARPDRLSYLLAFAISFALGLGIEIVQFFGPRDAALNDLATNAFGAAGVLAIHAAWVAVPHRPMRRMLLGMAGLCALLVLTPIAAAVAATIHRDRSFPVLASFDSWLDMRLITTRGATMRRVRWPGSLAVAGDGHALRVAFERPSLAGVVLEEPVADWSGHEALLIDIGNPAAVPLQLNVRIDDAWYDDRPEDRYDRVFQIVPGVRTTVRIPLESIRTALADRAFDLTRVSAVMLFRVGGDPADHCFIGPIRLE